MRARDHAWASVIRRDASSRAVALAIASWFAAVGVAWVIATDICLAALARDPVMLGRIETTTDWLFVGFASIVVYVVARRAASRLNRARTTLHTVLASVADGLIVSGRDQTVEYANPAALRLLGCTEEAQLIGMNAEEFTRRFRVSYLSGARIPAGELIAARAVSEPGPLHSRARLAPSENTEITIDTVAAPVRTRPSRRPLFVVSSLHDVTAAAHLEALRDNFFAGAAHTLKTPIAIIKANVQLLARDAATDSLGAAYGAIARQCDRIDRLVQNLQVVARARSHSLEVHLAPMALAPVVQAALADDSLAASNREVSVEVTAAPQILGDRERILTMVRDLIQQALRAARPGSLVVLRLGETDGDAELAVRYDAISVTERDLIGAEDYDDARIARAAIETIAEAHGGVVGEASADGITTTVWVRLPARGEELNGERARDGERTDGRADRG